MKRIWIDTHIHASDLAPDGTPREQMVDDLAELLDRCDADLRFVISCDGPYYGRMKTDPEAILRGNAMIHRLCEALPGRLYGACMVNPNHLAASLEAMDICFGQWGFVMLGEMLQYAMDYVLDCDASEAVIRKAAEWDKPVHVHLGTYWHKVHTGSTDGMLQLRDMLRAADRVPEAKWIMAHAIGVGPTSEFVPWADMFLDTMQGMFSEWPRNWWIEIRDFQSPRLDRVLREVPHDRILSGTDWTTRIGPPFQTYGTMFDVGEANNPFPPAVSSFVGFLKDAGASDEDVELVGWRNAAELMGLG